MADIKDIQPEGLKENQPNPPKAGALKRPATAQRKKKKTAGTTNFMKPAKPQDAPNNETAELQEAPIYGPPTEKEHWQAIKQAAEKAKADVWAKHEQDAANLPAKAEYWAPLQAWLKEHHPAVMEGYEAIKNDSKILLAEEKMSYRKWQIQPLAEVWFTSDPIGIKLQDQHNRRMTASHALDQQRDNALKAILEESFEATRRLQAIAEEERRIKREADYKRRLKLEQEGREDALLDAMGLELWRELNPDHPDFDREAFEQVCNLPNRNTESHFDYNFVFNGPTGTGKSRTMAFLARRTVEWTEVGWLTSARFNDLVTMLSTNRKDEARAELQRMAQVEFLFFDDLGAVEFTRAGIKHFYALMQARYVDNLATYFSTNYGRDGIERMLAPSGDPEEIKVAKAIIRRMIGTPAEPRAHLVEFKSHQRPTAKRRKAGSVC
jgi:DNA replication protein DnaC